MGSDNYTFSSRVTSPWDDNAGFEAQLERIITPELIANCPGRSRKSGVCIVVPGYPEVIP